MGKYIFLYMAFMAITASVSAQNLVPPPVHANNGNPENCYDRIVGLQVPSGDSILHSVPGSRFIWEYRFAPPAGVNDTYTVFGNTTSRLHQFTPISSFGLPQIDTQTNRYIRVKHVSGTAPNYTLLGISATIPVKFSPSAPEFVQPEQLPTTPSCSNQATGTIHIQFRKYTDTVLYIVRNSTDTAFCNPVTNIPPCLNILRSGRTADTSFVLTGMPAGQYAVLISNTGSIYGACNQVRIADIPALAPIQIDSSRFANPVCYNETTGEISLYVSGGDVGTYRFAISPQAGSFSYNNGRGRFSNLPPGNYFVTFKDTCGLTLVRNFSLINPPKIEGQVAKTVPDCASPGNGTISISAHYNFSVPGYSTFNYKIYKNGVAIDSLLNTTDTSFTKTGLTGGNYRAVAYSPVNPSCTGVDETFLLPFNPLAIQPDSVRHISCNGAANGYIKVKNNGGTGQYRYFLRNNSTGQIFSDTTGVFDNLPAATYTCIGMNRTTSCADSSILQITITQPPVISSAVTKQDIQCFNFNNGQLSATATGGNGGYTYLWEKQNTTSGNWLAYFQTGTVINNLGAGIYRSKITDIKNCTGYSQPVTIIEPDSLRIDSVRVQDIPCFAQSGHITLYSSGGNTGHIQQYRKLPDPDYINFTPATNLEAGAYLARVKDNKNCITHWPDTITITSPPSNLGFTYVQQQVNGYHITCFGAADGVITITAFGGNGGGYNGYSYTYDNQPWQTGNVLNNVPAGLRDIKVKDARGCIIIQQVLFREPSSILSIALVNTTHIACFGASTGGFSVHAQGGVPPYRYSINNGNTYQNDSLFTNLAAGVYNLLVRDANNCAGVLQVTINHLNTAITDAGVVTHVSCNGAADGAIASNIGGGVSPYSYLWLPGNATGSGINQLAAGNYTVQVTDNAGCVKQFVYTITQPAPINPSVAAYPVCFGASTGKIIITPAGGTRPYQFSKDNGVTWQPDSVFSSLPQATYPLTIKDAHNCTWTGSATIGLIPNNPNLNFIISSNQHEQDTLVMKEISWVKPDSVKWQFHPSATIIDHNPNEPKIKFSNYDTTAGYWIRLIGHYPTCTYTVQKTVKIYPYDPNAVVAPSAYNKGIKKAELFPNPNNGQFTLNVEFYKMQKVTVYVTSVPGVIVMPKKTFPTTMHLVNNFLSEMNGAQPGTYIMRIVSDYDSRNILFVKQ